MRRAAVIALMAVLGACRRGEAPVQPEPPHTPERAASPAKRAPVVTDRARYVMQEGRFGPEATIIATYTAPADHDAYLLNCNGAFAVGLQRPIGDRWEHVWLPEMNACMSPPIVIRAGESLRTTIVVDAAVSSRPTERKIASGTYRVIWHGLLGSYDPKARPLGTDLPVEQRVSAPIFIQAPPPDPSRPGAAAARGSSGEPAPPHR